MFNSIDRVCLDIASVKTTVSELNQGSYFIRKAIGFVDYILLLYSFVTVDIGRHKSLTSAAAWGRISLLVWLQLVHCGRASVTE